MKLHFTLDHDGYLPTVLTITDGRQHEGRVARQQHFEPGTILVFDMGYLYLRWMAALTARGVWFVTRLRSDSSHTVVDERPVPTTRHVLADNGFSGRASSIATSGRGLTSRSHRRPTRRRVSRRSSRSRN